MKRFSLAASLVIALFLFLYSCTSKPDLLLIGKWQNTNGSEIIEFLKNGSFHGSLIWDMTKKPVEVSGTFIVKGDVVNLIMEKPQDLTPMTWKTVFSGSNDELTITFQNGGALKLDGSASKYQRIR
jgi:hypothetical protein